MPRNKSEKGTPEDQLFLEYMRAWCKEMWRADGNHIVRFPEDSETIGLFRAANITVMNRIIAMGKDDRKAWVDAQK